ncbi:MAG: chemotaxis protein CheB [Cyclobacteriaceae bacterium]
MIREFEIIVMGMSAGGLHALSALLEKLPSDYPIPIVVVQHRTKDAGHTLEDVLQFKCRIKIKQADEKEAIKRSMVYLAPPDYHLLVERDRTFSLSHDPPVRFSRPSIDVLFESAAIAFGDKVIGIILTGASDDGADGIQAIERSGGITIAQNPDEALFPYMTQASIKTERVQHIWSLATIQNFLLRLINVK